MALSMLPAAAMVTEVDWITIAETAALSAVISILLSVVALPESNGDSRPFFDAVLRRTLRTMANAAVSMIPAGIMITAVDWKHVLLTAALAGISCVLTAIASPPPEADIVLPEEDIF